jgi:DNA-directed RNA polymerase subunit RPC12/RpoP
MQLVVAKCNNCGAAVRLDPSSPQVVCDYCHETLLVQGTGTAEVPRVTIAPPPEPLDEVRQTIGIAIGAAVLAVVGLVLAITTQVWVVHPHDPERIEIQWHLV